MKNYDAQFCGNLAIHQTNSIQDYGYLLVADKQTFEIIQGSENIDQLTTKTVQETVGTKLQDWFSSSDIEMLGAEVAKGERNRIPFLLPILVNGKAIPVNVLLHVKKDMLILEIEQEDSNPPRSFTEVFKEVRSFISTIEHTNSLEEICEASIKEIRRISGFDGIRMYRFDKNWNGSVVAEEITGELEPYLGQTFPASDVPKQARALYTNNPYRLIPNRSYIAYKLYPVINPVSNGFLDLSDCNLRSVAGVHLEYMANMHVMASMSIRVMVDGKLWGLISCHHNTPKYLSNEHRSIFEWLSMEISSRIAGVTMQETLTESTTLLKIQAAITENVFNKGSIVNGLIDDENQNLLSLFKASGFVVSINGKITSEGAVPDEEALENLLLWAAGKTSGAVFASHELGEVYDEARAYTDIASGVLVIPTSNNGSDFIMCFRPESIKDIKWGGDPNQAINFAKDGLKYHPRNSFKIWLQTVYGQAEEWSRLEVEAAESLKNFMFDFQSSQQYN